LPLSANEKTNSSSSENGGVPDVELTNTTSSQKNVPWSATVVILPFQNFVSGLSRLKIRTIPNSPS